MSPEKEQHQESKSWPIASLRDNYERWPLYKYLFAELVDHSASTSPGDVSACLPGRATLGQLLPSSAHLVEIGSVYPHDRMTHCFFNVEELTNVVNTKMPILRR